MEERIKAWIKLADDDMKTAKLTFTEGIYNQTCFHSQQCVEKCLKSLIEIKQPVPKIHRLPELMEYCKNICNDVEKFRNGLNYLDKFYTLTRYPFIPGMIKGKMPTKKDAVKSIKIAEKIYRFCLKVLHNFVKLKTKSRS